MEISDNRDTTTKANQVRKQGDKCPWCGEGTLTVSPSAKHLMCPKCGRMVILNSATRTQS